MRMHNYAEVEVFQMNEPYVYVYMYYIYIYTPFANAYDLHVYV